MSNWREVPCQDDYDRCTLASPGEAITFSAGGRVFLLVRQDAPTPEQAAAVSKELPDDMTPILGEVLMLTAAPLTPEQVRRADGSTRDRHAVLDEVHRTCEAWCVFAEDGAVYVTRRMPSDAPRVQVVDQDEAKAILRMPGVREAVIMAISIAMDCWPAWRAKGRSMGIASACDRVAARLTIEALQDAARAGMPVLTPIDLPEA